MSYDMIDHFLRNNLDDDSYAEYSAALDSLYTPQRTWVGLTDEEIESLNCVYLNWLEYEQVEIKGDKEFARAIEAKLKQKNTP